MKKMDKDEQLIMELLPRGMERPQPQRELMKLTGWSGRRVRSAINRLIVVYHKPIGARYKKPFNGYYIITNDQERAAALGPLKSQIAMMNKRAQIIGNADLSKE